MQSIQVAVYGTLKQGQENHGYLRGAEYIGSAWLEGFDLYDLGPWPAVKQGSGRTRVEVYRVDDEIFAALDELEEYIADAPHTGLYDRIEVATPHGRAWLYLYNPDVEPGQYLACGDWTMLNPACAD